MMKRFVTLFLTLCLLCTGAYAAEQDMLAKGLAFMEAGQYEDAAICFDIASMQSPGDAQVLAAWSRLYALTGDTDKALETIAEALKAQPANGEFYLIKAEILVKAGDLDAAKVALRYGEICGAVPGRELSAALNGEAAEPQSEAQAAASAVQLFSSFLTGLPETAPTVSPLHQAAKDGAALEAIALPEGYQMLSASPSGKVRILFGENGYVLSRDGEMIPLTINYLRGSLNQGYQEYSMKWLTNARVFIEQDSITWSPDERYFAITFPTAVVIQMRFYDLVLGDAQNGELFVAEATPTKFNVDGSQAVIAAAFDAESRYVYYLAYGRLGVGACALKRCEIATGKVELLYGRESLFMYQPHLHVLPDGSLQAVTDQQSQNETTGVVTFREANGRWTASVANFTQPVGLQRANRYLYNAASDHALMVNIMRVDKNGYYYLTLDGKALMLPVGGKQAELLPVSDKLPGGSYYQVVNAELSPDGQFALAMAPEGLFLVDLESLSFAQVTLPDGQRLQVSQAGRESRNGAFFRWFGDNTLLVPLQEGGVVYCGWGE